MSANRQALVAALAFGAFTFLIIEIFFVYRGPRPMMVGAPVAPGPNAWPLIAALIVGCVSFVSIRLSQR
jgi:hypothetical protein